MTTDVTRRSSSLFARDPMTTWEMSVMPCCWQSAGRMRRRKTKLAEMMAHAPRRSLSGIAPAQVNSQSPSRAAARTHMLTLSKLQARGLIYSTLRSRCTRQLTRASSSATTGAPECHQTPAARSTALAFHSKLSTPPTSPPAPPSLLSSIIVLHGVPSSTPAPALVHLYIYSSIRIAYITVSC